MIPRTHLAVAAFFVVAMHAEAQDSPQALATAVVRQWSSGSSQDFDAVFPFGGGRDEFTHAAQMGRRGGLSQVIRDHQDHAVLAISGIPVVDNSGDAVVGGRDFSGLYAAQRNGGRWALDHKIPFDSIGRISAQDLTVQVRPDDGLTVTDRLRVAVLGPNGFAARLNYRAKIAAVRAGNAPARFLFGGGLLWIDVPAGSATITLTYTLPVDQGPNATNSGCFLRRAGHVRSQYFWHPRFDFAAEGNETTFRIEARIPSAYHLTTSLPQSDTIIGAERVVRGATIHPTFALTLVYDRDWRVVTDTVGPLRVQLFLTPEFRPSASVVAAELRSVYALLSSRFGTPSAHYLAIVQSRTLQGNGWQFATNQIVVAGGSPQVVSRKEDPPRAFLGHELAHLWTQGSGAAANFLQEGWATYAESLILGHEFDSATVRRFWDSEADTYFRQFDGKASILDDPQNSGVAYAKGAWIFRMLEAALGTPAFDSAMTNFSRQSLAHAADWAILADDVQQSAHGAFDARAFLDPWLDRKTVPSLSATASGDSVMLVQQAPYFVLPVTIQARTSTGSERRSLWIAGASAATRFDGPAADPQVDPDHVLLIRR